MTELARLVLLLGCKATLILGVVALPAMLVGRRWPQHCTAWLRLAVVALLALPVAVWALPTIGIPLLPTQRRASPAGVAATRDGSATSHDLSESELDGESTTGSSLVAIRPIEAAPHGWSAIAALPWCLALAYGLVATVLAIRFACAFRGLDHFKENSSLVDDSDWQAALAHWSAALGVRQPVELRAGDQVSVPVTFGWCKPVIMVPCESVASCDKTEREAILIHELTHIAQGDFFWQVLTRLTGILYWLHPLVWLVTRQDGALRERICDALCSRHLGCQPYGEALVRIACRVSFRPAAALGIAMAHPSSLKRRISDLAAGGMAPDRSSSRLQRLLVRAAAAVVLGSIVVGTLTTRARAVADGDQAPTVAGQDSVNAEEVAPIRLPDTMQGKLVDREDRPVAGASVTIKIIPCKPSGEQTDAAAPKPWTATADNQGRYSFSTGEQPVHAYDVIGIEIRAEGFADLSRMYFVRQVTDGALPTQRLRSARKIRGRIVDPDGNPVAGAAVRFMANARPEATASILWFDSGPLPVDKDGAFSVSIPADGQAAFAIYPKGFAPRIVDVPEDGADADLGPIGVERGIALTGRVLDKSGQGVADTVVAIRSTDQRSLYAFILLIGTAVKTDETGSFTLPPLSGSYWVRVTGDAPDYSRRLMVTGSKPPPIRPRIVDFDAKDAGREIILREGKSVTVRGTVRWADGSGVADVGVRSYMPPEGWELESTHTDAQGRYTLRLPAPLEHVHVNVSAGSNHPEFKPIGTHADARGETISIEPLTEDVHDADWVAKSKQ
ncbi:MAG TPA: M56 family metallopeptidase [Pirellulales bacterium]|jgi:beta-lactamase regulating signal transducer with metallopeptidase domain/protocatechuate 3,4-dioxygenase beta subunit|nr:M56 family metallopeptidase [Pirellulales bacterium]